MYEHLKQSTLAATTTLLREKGFKHDVEVDGDGLYIMGHKERYYKPDEVHIISVIRFEGASDPGDMAALYLVELTDGNKGQLVDAYGLYANKHVGEFLKRCEFHYDASTHEP